MLMTCLASHMLLRLLELVNYAPCLLSSLCHLSASEQRVEPKTYKVKFQTNIYSFRQRYPAVIIGADL